MLQAMLCRYCPVQTDIGKTGTAIWWSQYLKARVVTSSQSTLEPTVLDAGFAC